MPSSSLDDYELSDIIGVGTVGTIYLGIDLQTGHRVAVKKLHASVCRDPLIRARFKREMTVMERLRHDNIVDYFGGGTDDQTLYYVMEVVDGGTVKEILERTGPLPWSSVARLSIQICSALQWAHNHGVIHRDLKPGNLFLTKEGKIKLGDFGIARDLTRSDLTAEGFTVGTHAYMAPEQIRGESSISGKVDLYALGCCMFEMLTGRKPFLGENYAQLFDEHIKQKPPLVSQFATDCPRELSHLIDQLLAKDADDRPFNARQVQATLLQILDSETQTEPDPLIERIKTVSTPVTATEVSLLKLVIVFAVLIAIGAAAAIFAR